MRFHLHDRITAGFVTACLTLVLASVNSVASAKSDRPNIILILSDDVGIGNIGCYGGSFKTPNIDALAKGGIQFTQAYTTPLCGPTRCQLLTGRYPFRTGHNSNQSKDSVDPKSEVMIPTVLKKAGYATCSVGKWGQIQLGPGEWGFDEYLVYPGSGRFWRDQTEFYTVNGTQQDLPEGKYLPEVMHQFIVDFIDKHKAQPFFVYYSMSHMHAPIVHTPESEAGADADQLYKDNNAGMDRFVGRLVEELDRQKLRDKTLVIFTADNGTARMGVELAKVDAKPISGQKGTMLEGGARVPFVASWPGVMPAGKVNNYLTDSTDLLVTFADLAGAELPVEVKFDGQSIAPQLRGEKGKPRDWVYVELNGNSYVRNGRYKLTNHGELFDLKNAPFEELAIPSDSTDAEAVAARSDLQKVLDNHQALPGKKVAKNPARKARKAMRNKAQRRKKAADAA
jgi:arylsulfatase A